MDINIDFSAINYANAFWALLFPVFLMVIDFLTGFINAWATRNIKSYIMRQGLAKKFGECCVLMIGLMVIESFNAPVYLFGFFSFYIVLMEVVSICENLDKLRVPIPKWVKRGLGTIHEKIQNGPKHEESKKKEDEVDGSSHKDE